MADGTGAISRSELISKGSQLQPSVLIGKGGLTSGVLDEARGLLKARELIKVKAGPAMGRGAFADMAREMADALGAQLLQLKGRTLLLYLPRGKK